MADEINQNTQATEQNTAKSTQSAAGGASSAGAAANNAPELKFSQEDMNKAITERLDRQRKQLEKQYAAERAEAERVAAMTAEQKAEHEREQREKQLADREAELIRREMTAVAKEQLAAKNIPAVLLNAVDITSSETITSSVEEISKAFSAAVAAEVAKKLAADPPKAGADNRKDSMAAIRAAAGIK